MSVCLFMCFCLCLSVYLSVCLSDSFCARCFDTLILWLCNVTLALHKCNQTCPFLTWHYGIDFEMLIVPITPFIIPQCCHGSVLHLQLKYHCSCLAPFCKLTINQIDLSLFVQPQLDRVGSCFFFFFEEDF